MKRKSLALPGFKPRTVQPLTSLYTDCAALAHSGIYGDHYFIGPGVTHSHVAVRGSNGIIARWRLPLFRLSWIADRQQQAILDAVMEEVQSVTASIA